MKQIIKSEIKRIEEDILDLSQYLLDNPEPALKEFKAVEKITAYLKDQGFEVEGNLGGLATAFKATKKTGEGPKLVYVAEYDALPEYGHACGHHLIAGMGVGAGVVLAKILEEIPGEVTIIGTPAEETGDGKPVLVEQGYFTDYDAAMMIHPFDKTVVDPVITPIGGYDFVFNGKTSHAGGAPHNGVNALDGVVMLYNAISVLRQQLRDDARISIIILEGGTVANAIPDKARIRLEFRALDMDYFNKMIEKAINCAKGAALATGCEVDYAISEIICAGLDENERLAELFRETLNEYGVEEDGHKILLGASDIGNVGQVIPTIHPMLKVVQNGEGLHTSEFLEASFAPYAKKQMMLGIELLAMTGLKLFQNQDLIGELKK
jgi:amidohydrolase